MVEVANDYAAMLREWGDAPIDVLGVSTGGSVALQLALDHPDLVRHLVLLASGCRLGARGQAAHRSVMDSLRSGDRCAAWPRAPSRQPEARRTRCRTRSGWSSASCSATLPPVDTPRTSMGASPHSRSIAA